MKWIWIPWILVLLISCGPHQTNLDPTKQSDKQLYEMGKAYLEEEDYLKAREAFKVVFDNFPKSEYRILAKLGIADSYYFEGNEANYLLAISEYQDFISLFPFSPKAEYAQVQLGMCYYNMREKSDRDPTNTRKALDEFRKAIDGYPNGEYYSAAQQKLLECYSILADHEYQIAFYYHRTKRYGAAIDRLKGILKSYPEGVFRPEYYYFLAFGLEQLDQSAEACTHYRMLLEKWPSYEKAGDVKESTARVCK